MITNGIWLRRSDSNDQFTIRNLWYYKRRPIVSLGILIEVWWWFSKSENSQKIKSGKLMFGGNGEQKHFFFVPFTTKNIIDFYEVDGIVVCYDV